MKTSKSWSWQYELVNYMYVYTCQLSNGVSTAVSLTITLSMASILSRNSKGVAGMLSRVPEAMNVRMTIMKPGLG